ncbi:cathepsin O-like [Vanessa atalanta]|uniref:cathepsin O-like n=1 Tax=Vanessa atalanta TaxID=42275 RepID=UPI001FCCC22C|nr:cathepsin O-like [Vanessa atalanta]
MKKWWNWILVLALVGLLFIVIPLTYPKSKTKDELRPMFDSYIQKFNKTYKYNLTEYETRLEHFCHSVKEIETLNSASKGPEHLRAKYGLTKLSDLSKAEFQEIHLSDEKPHHNRNTRRNRHRGRSDKNYMNDRDAYTVSLQDDNEIHNGNKNILIRKRRAAIPLRVDWREKGVIGPVRDQGLCGACWAFSTVGTMEAMAAINTGKLSSLSVQEVIDCAGLGNSGCLGGDICLLLDWLMLTDTAIQPDNEYPLKLTNGVCHKKANATGVRVKSFTCDDLIGEEETILQLIATHGPVSVAVNALTWQNYLGGVIQFHCSGSPLDLNHAVELVGYDISADVPYYIAKNSWGKMFGTDGYILLAIGSNICGLANEVASIDIKP